MKTQWKSLAGLALALGAAQAGAASISLSPASATVDLAQGSFSFDLSMSFAASEATLGGGLDLDLTGPISFVSFTPSAWFGSVPDPQLSGHGSVLADHDYEVHFGNFGGLSGDQSLGTLTVRLVQAGAAGVALSTNSTVGSFFTAAGAPQGVTLNGAALTISAVPEPATLALWLLGGGALAARRARRRAG